jgi:glutamine cyclotransferase
MEMTDATDVMNGIAYDTASKALYVTGKNWPHVYQISVQ